MKIAHFADVHFRGLARHDEYRDAFIDAFEKLKVEKPDVIYIGGDIVHSKTQGITPEVIDILSWWFTELTKIAPVDVILGNHDGLILNKDRQDAITPIISALNNPRLRLFKQSGVFDAPIDGFKWCVFSPFDVAGWPDVVPAKGNINIAFYHGAVKGAKSDSGMELEGEVTIDLFEKFDFALLGDIHQQQFLNDAGTIAYCGSTIQQNYGEEVDKGFLFWDIKTKNNFTTKFISVKNDMPFHTIDWKGDVTQTLGKLSGITPKARIRYALPADVNEHDVRSLYTQTQSAGKFSEITTKSETVEQKATTSLQPLKSENVRDKNVLKIIIDDYLKSKSIEDRRRTAAMSLFDKYYDTVVIDDEVVRNIVWSLKRFEFDNLFSYGPGNSINFDKLDGITGIFGKNRSGKSSVIGSIAYALFNTSDRGSMKNLHIINSNADDCKAKIVMSVAEEVYEIERETNKVFSKKSDVSASTKLSLKKRSTGDVLKDLNDEQRRETEKIVRKLIGTADDFFYTCLAPQGQMNMFINEKSTSRKQILSRFLDLEIFDLYHEKVKQDLSPIKASLKTTQTLDVLVKNRDELIEQKSLLEKEADNTTTLLDGAKEELQSINNPSSEIINEADITSASQKVNRLENELTDLQDKLDETIAAIKDFLQKLEKIEAVKSTVSIEDLRKQEETLKDLEMKFAINTKDLETKNSDLEKLKKRTKILDDIPCGDSYPTCIFIKDAHQGKSLIKSEEETQDAIARTLTILADRIKEINKDDIKGKIEKIGKLASLSNEIIQQKLKSESSIPLFEERISTKKNQQFDAVESLKTLQKKKDIQDKSGIADQHKEFIAAKNKVSALERDLIVIASNRGRNEEKINNAIKQIEELKESLGKHEVLTLLENAFSKKGIPQSIIAKYLPLINAEISKILTGISGFTVEIECDESNNIEIYIVYDEKKRIIELGSGMEKMISSIAIRVALTSISSLPKSDMLIIDEGFGALDESNLEACARLLQNLKGYFKKIVIISHVDAIKDVVDNMIVIETNGERSRVNYE